MCGRDCLGRTCTARKGKDEKPGRSHIYRAGKTRRAKRKGRVKEPQEEGGLLTKERPRVVQKAKPGRVKTGH